MSVLALIQARMGSTRLPGKSMALLSGVPLIEHVVRRVRAASLVQDVMVCTTTNPADDELAAHVDGLLADDADDREPDDDNRQLAVDVFRGSENDVLGRMYWASQRYPSSQCIVRITADDPFKDPALIDLAITAFLLEWGRTADDDDEALLPPQYLHLGGLTWALGMDVEVFTRDALNLAHTHAHSTYEREHPTEFMKRSLGVWQLKDVPTRRDMNTRYTIDTAEDLEFARKVYDALYPANPLFGYDDIIAAGF
jgi:spore coat polysaccharide biosynthesis protein SpsF